MNLNETAMICLAVISCVMAICIGLIVWKLLATWPAIKRSAIDAMSEEIMLRDAARQRRETALAETSHRIPYIRTEAPLDSPQEKWEELSETEVYSLKPDGCDDEVWMDALALAQETGQNPVEIANSAVLRNAEPRIAGET